MGDAKAPTTPRASAPRSSQSESGLAPVIIPLPALTSYWGVGGRIYILSLKRTVTDLINRIVQVLKKDLYWVKISTQNAELIEPVKIGRAHV